MLKNTGVWGGMVFVLEGLNMWCRAKQCSRRCVYQREALGGGGPSLYGCQRPLLHHVLRLLVHTHHRLFGYPQQPRDQLIFTLHLFLSDEEASHRVYAGVKHLHRWFIQGAGAENARTGVTHMLCLQWTVPRVEEEKWQLCADPVEFRLA